MTSNKRTAWMKLWQSLSEKRLHWSNPR